ncbi:MAG: hypothetical protein DI537_62015 [Stutzerimonas stutzeri]|nr:MAG: hypothetical protein DI537_62015 [Stutzerimonas stutzeri]
MAFYLLTAEYLSRYFQQFAILFGLLLLVVLRFAPDGLYVATARIVRDACSRFLTHSAARRRAAKEK